MFSGEDGRCHCIGSGIVCTLSGHREKKCGPRGLGRELTPGGHCGEQSRGRGGG